MDTWLILGLRQEVYEKNLQNHLVQKIRMCSKQTKNTVRGIGEWNRNQQEELPMAKAVII